MQCCCTELPADFSPYLSVVMNELTPLYHPLWNSLKPTRHMIMLYMFPCMNTSVFGRCGRSVVCLKMTSLCSFGVVLLSRKQVG
jgi:hypothetical protein